MLIFLTTITIALLLRQSHLIGSVRVIVTLIILTNNNYDKCLQVVLGNTTLPFSLLFFHFQTKPYTFPWEPAFLSISFYSPLQAPQDSVPGSQPNTSESPLSLGSNMRSYRYLRAGLLQKLMVLVFLSLLVSGQKEEAMEVCPNGQSPGIQEKQQQKQQQQQQRLRHSLDVFLSSKRRVPNASDPLHNR